jgi:cell division protein ZapA
MGQVAITVNGRSYRFECGDGEEARLKELAAYVKSRMDGLTREHGNVGEERLLLMTALLIADDLWDATSGEQPASAA